MIKGKERRIEIKKELSKKNEGKPNKNQRTIFLKMKESQKDKQEKRKDPKWGSLWWGSL
jgi:hypothetical protein